MGLGGTEMSFLAEFGVVFFPFFNDISHFLRLAVSV
jgi:hypothetical protein